MALKQIIDSRQKMYAYILPKNAVIAELGVSRGHNAFDLIIPLSNPKEFHLIDDWKYGNSCSRSEGETLNAQEESKNKASEYPNCTIHIGDTVEVTIIENTLRYLIVN